MNACSHHENVWYGMVQSPNASCSSAWHSHAFLPWRTAIFTYTLCCWSHSEMEVCNVAITLACEVYVHSYIYTCISHTHTHQQTCQHACTHAHTCTHTHTHTQPNDNIYEYVPCTFKCIYTRHIFTRFSVMPLTTLHHYLNHVLIFVLTSFGCLCSIMLNPYFWWQYHFCIYTFLSFTPTYSKTQLLA